MPSEWSLISLADANIVLIDCVHKTPPKATHGLPYLAIPQMKTGTIYLRDARRITREHFEEWTQKADPQPHDVVLSRRCNPGVTAAVTPGARFALGQNLVLLRADGTEVHRPYLKWLVRSPEWWEQVGKFINVGAVFDSLRCADVPKFELLIPPLDDQRRIAAVLGALDDKIELNRKMNRTLEEMAQAIFKSWFIDFDGHDDLVDSDVGPIPKGWEVQPVTRLVRFNPRTPLKNGTLARFVEMKGLPTGGCSVTEVGKRVLKSGGAKFMQGDTLLARITPCLENGKTALVDFLGQDEVAFGSTEFIVMRPDNHFSPTWVYCLARSTEFRQHAISNMTGSSGRQRVPVDCFEHFGMCEPDQDVLAAFRTATEPLFDRIKGNGKESLTLAELRDTLLPKLISGEIRVPEAEEAVDAA